MESRIDQLERALLSAIEKNKQPAPPEKVNMATGQEEQFLNYGSQGDMEYMAQVNAAGSWNTSGSWNPGRQRDAPWRDHPNFRWGEGNQNQSNPPQNTYNGPSSQDAQPNWSGRSQQNQHQPNSNQNSAYVPPHQRGYPNHQNNQPLQYQNHPGPNQNYNHNPHQPNNYFSNQNSHQGNQGSLIQHPPYQNHPKHPRHFDDVVGELLNSQQHLQNNMQSNNDVVHKMQDAQKEQKTSLDMLAKQLSQITTSLNELRGNEGRIPASIKLPDKANVSQITLCSGRNYKRPMMRPVEGVLNDKDGSGIKLTQRLGQEGKGKIDHIEELAGPLPKDPNHFFLEEEPVPKEDPKPKEVQ